MKHVELNTEGVVVTVRSAPYPTAETPITTEAPDNVECGWRLAHGEWVEPAESAAVKRREAYPDCEAYQLRTWMVRQGLSLAAVPQIIEAVIPAGVAREEALVRWEYAIRIPRDHPLVNLVAASMEITPQQVDEAWPTILSI